MGRPGGRRDGAGRKSNISKVDRLLIGARCESEWDALKEASALEVHKSRLVYEDLERNRGLLHELPHKTFASGPLKGKSYRTVVVERAEEKKLRTDDLPARLAEATDGLHWIIWDELISGEARNHQIPLAA